MKVLIVGSGGREHVMAWKIDQSPKLKKLYCAPGNGGIAEIAECVNIQADDIKGLLKFAKKEGIDLTVVGPEAPLVKGIVDAFQKEGLLIFGPNQEAAQLEGSKVFSKEFMHRKNIPTATYKVFDTAEEAQLFIKKAQFPLVIKADGLAAGKGVIICDKRQQADEALEQIMGQKIFKEAGNRIVVEEFLDGEEASILAISDGENYVVLESSQDHKRIFDDDLGPNTGGMGAYSPAPIITDAMLKKIEARIIEPTIRGMFRDGIPFKGVLYAGLIVTSEGPKALEYNVRFGDPEAQAVLPRLKTDLLDLILASCNGTLEDFELNWDHRSSCCVVMSSGGYPGKYETGKIITGIDSANKTPDSVVYHAGTRKEDGSIYTDGGRVLGVTSLGDTLDDAIERAYEAVEKIKFEKCFFRRDIGAKALRKIKDHQHKTSSRI